MINFNNIHLSFNNKTVINDLSLDVKSGEKVLLAGKSGSGKSSLLSMLLGFIEPNRGEILFEGVPVDKNSAWFIRKKIAYVDQDVSISNGKILDFINFISGLKANRSLDFGMTKVNELFSHFELNSDTLDKEIGQLSGGERQRLAIVIAILLERKVFLIDEGTSSLDKHLKKKVTDYFMGKKDWTCIVVSHDEIWLDSPDIKIFDMDGYRWRQ